MIKKLLLAAITVVLTAAISIPGAFAAQESNPAQSSGAPEIKQQISLTDAQKKEMKQLYDKMYETKKEIIKKYLDFGVITKEKADKKLKRLDEMQKKIEQNGYAPWHGKGKS